MHGSSYHSGVGVPSQYPQRYSYLQYSTTVLRNTRPTQPVGGTRMFMPLSHNELDEFICDNPLWEFFTNEEANFHIYKVIHVDLN